MDVERCQSMGRSMGVGYRTGDDGSEPANDNADAPDAIDTDDINPFEAWLARSAVAASPHTHAPRLPKRKLFLLRTENDSFPWSDYERPHVRADCLPGGVNEMRPCPFVTCRWHLAVNVNEASGSFTETFPGRELTEMPATCSLDIADEGGATLEEIGDALNVTREAARLIEAKAIRKLRDLDDVNLQEHNPHATGDDHGSITVSDDHE